MNQVTNNKEKIISLLRSIQRDGIEDVIEYLEKNDFFLIPSSLSRHHNWEGGLAEHCLGVYDRLNKTGEQLPPDSKILVSLLHDICKVGRYQKDEAGNWKEEEEEKLEFPGHGNRSVLILENLGLKLNEEEKRAIRWHMGGWKIGDKSKEEIRDFFITKKSDLWRLLHNADRYDSSHHPARTS